MKAMSSPLKEECPVCGMALEQGKDYPTGFGKRFCCEECLEEYGKREVKDAPGASRG